MATTIDEVTAKIEKVEIETKTKATLEPETLKEENKLTDDEKINVENGAITTKEGDENVDEGTKAESEKSKKKDSSAKEEIEKEVAVEIEPKTGISFPTKLDDGKQLTSVGVRKKSVLGIGFKIYGFGMYADNEKLKELMRSKIGKAPEKPTKEMYQLVIDSDVGIMVRLVIAFAGLTMSMVRKNFDEGLGASIKKLNGGQKNEELTKRVMGEASDDIKLASGSVIEITRLPGYILHTTVKGELVSKVDSELICRAYMEMYLGNDVNVLDKEAKEKFGAFLLSLF